MRTAALIALLLCAPFTTAQAQFSAIWSELADPGGRVGVNPVTGQLAYDHIVGSYFEVHTANADGSSESCLSCGRGDLPTRHIGNPVWSPDGEWLVFQAQKSAATTTDAFSTPGIGVFNDLYAYNFDADTAYLIHSVTLTVPAQGLLHPQFNHAGDQLMWAEMTDGSGGFNGSWKITIADWDPDTQTLSNLTDYTPSSKTFFETHGWAPDDSRILYSAAAVDFDDLDIWAWDLSGSPVNLTGDVTGAWDEHAHYSPDGSRIVWMSSRGQSFDPLQTDWWVMKPDGSEKTRLTNFSDSGAGEYRGYNAIAADFDWRPNGKDLVGYVQQTGTTPDDGELLAVAVRSRPAQPIRRLSISSALPPPTPVWVAAPASNADACDQVWAALGYDAGSSTPTGNQFIICSPEGVRLQTGFVAQ